MTDIRMGGTSVWTSTLGIKFADGTTQTTAATGGSGGNATEIQGIPIDSTPPNHNGEILIFDSVQNKYIPGDPLVQGLFAEGTATSGINPILIAGKDVNGNQRDLATDISGNLGVRVVGSAAVTGTFWQTTQPVSLVSTTI